jgi:hypothetical protein
MTTQQSDAVREQLNLVLVLLTPYARSSGAFHDADDVREAATLAAHALERALTLLTKP